MTLRIIGAGFGRTGTDSMREALNMLGFGPCHHMFEVTENPLMKARWGGVHGQWRPGLAGPLRGLQCLR